MNTKMLLDFYLFLLLMLHWRYSHAAAQFSPFLLFLCLWRHIHSSCNFYSGLKIARHLDKFRIYKANICNSCLSYFVSYISNILLSSVTFSVYILIEWSVNHHHLNVLTTPWALPSLVFSMLPVVIIKVPQTLAGTLFWVSSREGLCLTDFKPVCT